jgi:hypothetical protein
VQHRAAVAVVERHALEGDRAARHHEVLRAGRIGQRVRRVQDGRDALERDAGAAHRGIDAGQALDGAEQAAHVLQRGDQRADRAVAGEHQPGAERRHRQARRGGGQALQRRGAGVAPRAARDLRIAGCDGVEEAPLLGRSIAKPLTVRMPASTSVQRPKVAGPVRQQRAVAPGLLGRGAHADQRRQRREHADGERQPPVELQQGGQREHQVGDGGQALKASSATAATKPSMEVLTRLTVPPTVCCWCQASGSWCRRAVTRWRSESPGPAARASCALPAGGRARPAPVRRRRPGRAFGAVHNRVPITREFACPLRLTLHVANFDHRAGGFVRPTDGRAGRGSWRSSANRA